MTALECRSTVDVECCDHCGCRTSSLALDASPWFLRRCHECEFVYTSPRRSDEALVKIYADEYYENSETYAAQQVQRPLYDHIALARRARRILGRRRQMLTSVDVGCGGGRLVRAFTDEGFCASGIEPSEITVRAARAIGRNITTEGVADLPDVGFDCVTVIHVLEHVLSPKEFVAHLFRITKPGGLCIVEVPNFACRASRQQGAAWHALHPGTHLSHFTPSSLINCLQQPGFHTRSVHRLGGAGVFADVAEATARKTATETSARQGKLVSRILAHLWTMRSAVIAIPPVRRFARWINWELLGHGEFVQVLATKPRI